MGSTMIHRSAAVFLGAALLCAAAGAQTTQFADAQDKTGSYQDVKAGLQDKEHAVRQAAIEGAAGLDKTSGCALLQDHLMKERNIDLFSKAMASLERVGSDQAVGILSQIAKAAKAEKMGIFLTDGVNPYISLWGALNRIAPPHMLRLRLEAIAALSRIGSKEALDVVFGLLQDSDAEIACFALKALYGSQAPCAKEKFLLIFNAKVTEKMVLTPSFDQRKRIAESVGDRIGLLKLTALQLIVERADPCAIKQVTALIPEHLARLKMPVTAARGDATGGNGAQAPNALGGNGSSPASPESDLPQFAAAPPRGWEMNSEIILAGIQVLVAANSKESVELLDRIAEMKDSPGSTKVCKEWIAKIRNAAADGARKLR